MSTATDYVEISRGPVGPHGDKAAICHMARHFGAKQLGSFAVFEMSRPQLEAMVGYWICAFGVIYDPEDLLKAELVSWCGVTIHVDQVAGIHDATKEWQEPRKTR